jgi:putative acetyltransferase
MFALRPARRKRKEFVAVDKAAPVSCRDCLDVISPPATSLDIRPEDPRGEAAVELVTALTRELAHRYADLGDDGSGGFAPQDVAAGRGVFLVARLAGVPVGCAALRPLPDGTGEIKRMYVLPAARRQGVAQAVLAALEKSALESGYATLRLETGMRQPEALALYARAGFRRIPAFGTYVDNPISVCFEKQLRI